MALERITMDDVVKSGHCVRGAKAWFEARGFNWRGVVKNGVSVSDLRQSEDALAEQVIAAAEARADG